MVENNDFQDKIVIRQALKKDAETVFKMIRHLPNTTVMVQNFVPLLRMLNEMDLENFRSMNSGWQKLTDPPWDWLHFFSATLPSKVNQVFYLIISLYRNLPEV